MLVLTCSFRCARSDVLVLTCSCCGDYRILFPVHLLPQIGNPRLNTGSSLQITALSECFSPQAVLTLSLELLPYQSADTRLSRFPIEFGFIGASGDLIAVSFL